MKRFLAVLLTAALCVTLCLTLTACDTPKIRVESVLNLNNEFKGSRTVTVVYPLSADIDAIKDDIIEDNPADDVDGAKFTYLGATENGYSFELKLSFDNLSDYEAQVGAILGRDANAVLAHKDTVMFSGTRMAEDFDVSELISWMTRKTGANDSTKDYTFEYPYNKVNIGSESFDTGSTVKVNEGKGIQVNSVDVKTYNEKASLFGRTFDRSFVFTIPADTYSEYKRKINAYFEELTGGEAQISDTHEGNNILFTVTYEGLNLSELEATTAAVLDSDGVSIYYGDKENLSSPMFEGRLLEETLDTLSFDGADGNAPTLRYTYSLPTNAVKGEGALYKEGSWEDVGTWDDGAFRFEDATGLSHLRIFDGRQYYIDGVSIELLSLGDGKFRRVTSFLYPVDGGFEGPVYAARFFDAKNAETESDNDGEHVVLSVIIEGDTDEVNASLQDIFGKGNFITYDRESGALSDKTTFIDYIDLRDTLSVENASVKMTYTASAENGENIVTVTNGGAETAYQGKAKSAADIDCVAAVGFHGVIPKAGNILLYIICGVLLFGATTLIAYRMLMPPIRRERAEHTRRKEHTENEQTVEAEPAPEDEKIPSYAPTQTTTFSIFELGALSRNKKYVDEINKDVENRLHADRIEQRKQELRQKELEEMERKVYGKEDIPAEPQDDAPPAQEILDTLAAASKAEPQQAEPTDPMALLDLMNGEEQDD